VRHILWLFIFSPLIVSSQLSGEYSTYPNFVTESIDFRPNNEFIYRSSGCTSRSVGHGHYTTKDSFLTLIFEVDQSMDTTIQVKSLDPHNDSLITIDMSFYEDGNVPLQGAYAAFDKTGIGCASNESGHCIINYKKSDTTGLLKLGAVGFGRKEYLITLNKDYGVKVYFGLNQLQEEAKQGEVRKYIIRYNRRASMIDLKKYGSDRGFETYLKGKWK